MAVLPGWDRHRLATAEPRDVEAARWVVYARTWERFLRINFDAKIDEVEAIDRKESETTARARRRRQIAELRAGIRTQEKVRNEILEIDVEDEPEEVEQPDVLGWVN